MKNLSSTTFVAALFSAAVLTGIQGCAGAGKPAVAGSTEATQSADTGRPANVPPVDMAGAIKVEESGETYWKHAPTEADAAALLDKRQITTEWATLYVNGLGCPQCASNIDLTLAKVEGVKWIYVDLGHGVVQLQFEGNGQRPSPFKLMDKVTDAGFTLVKIRTQG